METRHVSVTVGTIDGPVTDVEIVRASGEHHGVDLSNAEPVHRPPNDGVFVVDIRLHAFTDMSNPNGRWVATPPGDWVPAHTDSTRRPPRWIEHSPGLWVGHVFDSSKVSRRWPDKGDVDAWSRASS